MKHLFRWMAALILLACTLGRIANAADDFLPPEQAF
jgi:thiol:disulfide interchange protein DsbD